MSSITASSSSAFCDEWCSGHPGVPDKTLFPSSETEFIHAISCRKGFTLEHLKQCALQLKSARVEGRRLKFPNNFCVRGKEIYGEFMVHIDNPLSCVSQYIPIRELSLDVRLTKFYIACQIKIYSEENPLLVENPHVIPGSQYARYESLLRDRAANACLTYPAYDHGLFDNLCRIPGLRNVQRYLSPEQRKAITLVEGASSTTLSEPMARSIVNTMHVATIVEQCVQVPALASFPPGLLPLVGSYVPDSIDDLSSFGNKFCS